MNTLSKLFKGFDFFGINVGFKYNGNCKMKSAFGGFLTLLYVTITASLFLGFGIDLYQRKNPKTSFNSLINDYEETTTSNDNFTFSFRIEDTFGQIFERTDIIYFDIFYFKFKQNSQGVWERLNYTKFDPSRCTIQPGYRNKENYFNISLSQWNCFNFDSDIRLGGNWDGNFVNGIQINARQCMNSTNLLSKPCAPSEEIQLAFENQLTSSNLFFSFLYPESMPRLNDYLNPLYLMLVNRYEMLNLGITKRSIQILKQVGITTDGGWLISDHVFKNFFTSDFIVSDFTFKEMWKQDIVYSYIMYLGRKAEVYSRVYTKVQEIFAQIGGFLKLFEILILYIYSIFSLTLQSFEVFNCIMPNSIPLIGNQGIQATSKLKLYVDKTLHLEPIEKKQQKASRPSKLINELSFYDILLLHICKNNAGSKLNSLMEYNKYLIKAFDIKSYLENLESLKTCITNIEREKSQLTKENKQVELFTDMIIFNRSESHENEMIIRKPSTSLKVENP